MVTRWGVLLVGVALLVGCETLRPHDQALDTKLTAAADAIEKLDPKVRLADQRAYLDQLWERTQTIQTNRVLAHRDDILTQAIRPEAEQNGWTFLNETISERSKEIVGKPELGLSGENLDSYFEFADPNSNFAAVRSALAQTLAAFRQLLPASYSTVDCLELDTRVKKDLVVEAFKAEGQSEADADGSWQVVLNALNADYTFKKKTYKAVRGTCAAFLVEQSRRDTYLKPVLDAPASSLLGATLGHLAEAEAEVAKHKRTADAAAAALKTLEEAHTCVLLRNEAASGAAAASLANTVLGLAAVFSGEEPPKEPEADEGAAGKTDEEKKKENDARDALLAKCGVALAPTPKAILESAGLEANDIQAVLDALKSNSKTEPLALALAQVSNEFQESFIGEWLQVIAAGAVSEASGEQPPAPETDEEKEAAKVKAGREALWADFTQFTANLARLDAAAAGDPGFNATVVSINYRRFKAASARTLLQYYENRRDTLMTMRDALLIEIAHLADAQQALKGFSDETGGSLPACATPDAGAFWGFAKAMEACKKANDVQATNAISVILSGTTQSFEEGRVPARISEFRLNHLERERNFAVQEVNLEAWVGLLKPAIDELAAYGQGGIKPETWARIANVLGLIPIGIGVND